MERTLRGLIDNLDREVELRRAILALTESIHRRLIEGDVDGLTESLREIHPKLQLAYEQKTERDRILVAIASGLALDSQKIKLSEVAEAAPPELREPLHARRAQLKDLLERTAEVNRLNARVVRQSLEVHQSILHILSGSDLPAPTYGWMGRKAEPAGPDSILGARSA